MVDAHCVRDEGGFTVQWLLRFIGLGLGYIYFNECVNHVFEKAISYPRIDCYRGIGCTAAALFPNKADCALCVLCVVG